MPTKNGLTVVRATNSNLLAAEGVGSIAHRRPPVLTLEARAYLKARTDCFSARTDGSRFNLWRLPILEAVPEVLSWRP